MEFSVRWHRHSGNELKTVCWRLKIAEGRVQPTVFFISIIRLSCLASYDECWLPGWETSKLCYPNPTDWV